MAGERKAKEKSQRKTNLNKTNVNQLPSIAFPANVEPATFAQPTFCQAAIGNMEDAAHADRERTGGERGRLRRACAVTSATPTPTASHAAGSRNCARHLNKPKLQLMPMLLRLLLLLKSNQIQIKQNKLLAKETQRSRRATTTTTQRQGIEQISMLL